MTIAAIVIAAKCSPKVKFERPALAFGIANGIGGLLQNSLLLSTGEFNALDPANLETAEGEEEPDFIEDFGEPGADGDTITATFDIPVTPDLHEPLNQPLTA